MPTDLLVVVGPPTPVAPKSMRFPLAPLMKIWQVPSAALLALVEISCPVRVPPASGSLVPSATVMSALPLNDTPLVFLDVCKVLAVVALPLNAAVMVPAEKFPLASLTTMALAVLALVAVVAELDTFPDVDIVASIALDTLPVSRVVISVPFVFGRCVSWLLLC